MPKELVVVRMDRSDREKLQAEADKQGRTLSGLIRWILANFLGMQKRRR